MFIGHFAVGFAAKRLAPRTSLAWLLLAPAFLDLLWPLFLATGIEEVRIDPGNTPVAPFDFVSYPWSHSLVMALTWGLVWYAGAAERRAGIVLGALVVSHWVLDWISHRPDLPIWPGGPRVGLGLWYSKPATIAVEVALYAAGVGLYLAATRARDRVGVWALVALVVVQVGSYVASLVGPPPPSVTAVEITAILAAVLFFAAGAWIERHRAPSV
jgi:hypothetical protein